MRNEEPDIGREMHDMAKRLWPICRSLTGDGVRQTHAILSEWLPLVRSEVPSGTQAFDWTVPNEWNIRDAYIANAAGERVVDFKKNNLHVVGYSTPIDAEMTLEELKPHLFALPAQPDAIPYVTSYYRERWGFCLSQTQLDALAPGRYRVRIDSTLQPGSLTYSECVIPGATDEEVFFSTYTCHPSMANNELSGPIVTAALARWVASAPRRYTYRFLFTSETIGSIIYLSRHAEHLKRKVVAGWVVTCIGDDRTYSYMPSRRGQTLADRVSKHVLSHVAPDHVSYSFLQRGSDERQYCSPRIDLPMCSIMRSKYSEFPEYHTSLDDLELVTPSGLAGGLQALQHCVNVVEGNEVLRAAVPCEPQLGKRGLYPDLSIKGSSAKVRAMMGLLAYADGADDLLRIAEIIGVSAWECRAIAETLLEHQLLERVPHAT